MNAPVQPPTPPYVTHNPPDQADEAPAQTPGARRRLIALIVTGVAAAAIAIYVLTHLGGDDAANAPVDPRQAVTVARVAPQAFTPIISLSGEARPVRDIQVVAPMSGVRILQLMADEGDTVRAGQALARLETSVATAQIRAAQAAVAEAQSGAVRARGEFDRADAIRESGALSTEAIEQRRAAAEAADARLAAARAQLAEVNARMQGGFVRAPVAGLVIDRSAQLGRLGEAPVL